MIFIDTNYFLRFLLKDNKEQFLVVKALFEKAALGEADLTTSLVVFFEIFWVLSSFYKQQKEQLVKILTDILSLKFIRYENEDILLQTVELFSKQNIDLEDCYNLMYAKEIGSEKLATFDKKLDIIFKRDKPS